MITKSKRPIFIIGNGVKISESKQHVDKSLERSKAPYAATWAVFDMFRTDDQQNIGSFGCYATRQGTVILLFKIRTY